MYGYAGKLLKVDLTNGTTVTEAIGKEMMIDYIGGKGFGAKILFEEIEPNIDPLGSGNLLILATGPANGLTLSGAAKLCAVFKSPLTGIWGESQCGGYFAPHLKFAGFDAIVIRGKSDKPVYFLVDDDKFEVKDAGHLWGKDTFETEDTIKRDNGRNLQVLSIGPAGENLVRYACISHDKGRELGRCGAGAVMGSKKLKAIAVHGTNEVAVAEPEKLKEFSGKLNELIMERLKTLREYGTPNLVSIVEATGSFPTRNWTEGHFEGAEKIGPETIKKTISKRSKACYACTVACRKVSKVESGPYAGTEVDGPEYETLFSFGSLCGNSNLESIVKANEICDRLGMDTISAGSTVAFAMECFEKGLITRRDTGGLDLHFGNPDAIVTLLKRIACRQGLGDVLAEGVRKASEIIGGDSTKFAVHVKGLEPPGYDPRALKGAALAYAVSCRGACHLRHIAHRPNFGGSHPFTGRKINRLSYEGQAQLVADLEDFFAVVDSMVLCKFVCLPGLGPIQWDEITELYNTITGQRIGKKDLMAKGVGINSQVRRINERMGVDKKADRIPARFTEPLKNGVSIGEKIGKAEFEHMLNEYYDYKALNNSL